MSLNLRKTVNAQQESVNKNVELLQQNISYLQKELNSKNETIKSLLEAQSALIESLNKPPVNEFRIPRSTMEPQQNQPMPTFNLQDQPERQNVHPSFRFRQNLQTNLNIEQDKKNNEQSSEFSKKILYVGNLSPVVTEEDLSDFFGFATTSYLQKTCKVELSVCAKTGNSRCFAYVTVPYHVYKAIIKLNGVVFKSQPIKIEDAK